MLKERDYFKEFCEILPVDDGIYSPTLNMYPKLKLSTADIYYIATYADGLDLNIALPRRFKDLAPMNIPISTVAVRQTFKKYKIWNFWDELFCDPDSVHTGDFLDALDDKDKNFFLEQLCIWEIETIYKMSAKLVINRALNKWIRGNNGTRRLWL